MATLERTLSYRRAIWLDVLIEGENLEEFCKKALRKRNQIGNRRLVRAGGQRLFCNQHYTPRSGGIFLHLVADTPGDHASVVSTLDDDKDLSEVRTARPPANREYLDGDIFLLVNGDNVCLCATALREAAAVEYFHFLFQEAELPDRSVQFDLEKIANVDKVRMIRRQGIKEIELDASLYEATMAHMNRGLGSSVLRKIGTHFKAFLDDKDIAGEDNVSVRLTLKADLRMNGSRLIGDKKLRAVAEDVILNPEAAYTIVTGTGQRFSNDEIVLTKKVNIRQHGKSIAHQAAWDALAEFYRETEASGATAQ